MHSFHHNLKFDFLGERIKGVKSAKSKPVLYRNLIRAIPTWFCEWQKWLSRCVSQRHEPPVLSPMATAKAISKNAVGKAALLCC